MNEDTSGDIQVVCRFRPLNSKELQISSTICMEISADKKSVSISQDNASPLTFALDYIFPSSTSQEEVYKIAARPTCEAVLQGFNGTVLAYGQTSSGKTFTMAGASLEIPDLQGIIPRMVSNIFDYISGADENLEFTVKVGYCEIYLEKIKDLLDPFRNNLKIHEDKVKGVYIGDLSESYVSTEAEVHELMRLGGENREVGYTDMNAGSSRSHAIFLITITQTNTKNYSTKVGKLYLVDLAGSEKIAKTGATGKRLEEAKTINKSLTVLGQVINNLTDGKSTHIPYRDSKLTRVLQESLGGNSKTTLIVTCSPSSYNIDETISTLRFGVRAKSVKNKPKVNKEYTVAELKLMLSKAQEEIEKRNLKITLLEKELGKNETDFKCLPLQGTEVEDKVNFDEIFEELENIKTKFEQECKISSHLRNNLIQQDIFNQELRLDNASMMSELKSCHEELLELRKSINEKSEKIEELLNAKELYEAQIQDFNFNIVRLEQTITEREIEIAKLKSQFHFGKESHSNSESEDNNQLKLELILDKEKINSLNKQIKLLHENFEEIAKKKSPNLLMIQENLKQEIEIREEAKWSTEKEMLNKDLQNRIKKVIDLQLELDDSKENLRCLELRISQGDKVIIKRNEYLEKCIENISKMYNHILNEKSALSVNYQVLESKANRFADKIKMLEEQINKQKDYLKSSEERSFADEIARLNNSRASRSSQISGNIRKPLKGGGRNTLGVKE